MEDNDWLPGKFVGQGKQAGRQQTWSTGNPEEAQKTRAKRDNKKLELGPCVSRLASTTIQQGAQWRLGKIFSDNEEMSNSCTKYAARAQEVEKRHKALPDMQTQEEKGKREDKRWQTKLPAGNETFVIQKQLHEHLYRSTLMDVGGKKV